MGAWARKRVELLPPPSNEKIKSYMSISNNYLSKAVFIVFSNNHPYCTGQTDTIVIVGGGDGGVVMGGGVGWW